MFKYNKMWVAGIAAPLSTILGDFITVGLGITFIPNLDMAIAAVVTAAVTWLVPNVDSSAPTT